MSVFTLTQSTAAPMYMLSKTDSKIGKKKKGGQMNNADVEEDQIIAGTCGRSHQVSVDGARSVCSVCQGDVPQETIEETIVFKI